MSTEIRTEQYRALAELRHQIRQFLSEGDRAARAAGLEPQQYLVLLMIRGDDSDAGGPADTEASQRGGAGGSAGGERVCAADAGAG
jgi:hypothetical protein